MSGWDDPLISVANTLTLPPGVSLPAAYTGLLGPYRNETNTVEDLVAAIAAGTADRRDYEYEVCLVHMVCTWYKHGISMV